jgi:hypothetical protein
MTIATTFWPDAPILVAQTTARLLAEAEASGVQLILGEGARVPYPNGEAVLCSGYFTDRPTPVLATGMGGPWADAFPVLLHEFAHMNQWREGIPEWAALFDDGVEAADWIDHWLAGQDVPIDRLQRAFRAARAIEMDCEKRVLRHIARDGLPLDPIEYAQKANAYVLFYHWAEQHRAWYPATKQPPYRTPEIWSQAPTTLGDPEVLPPALSAAFDAHYGPSA